MFILIQQFLKFFRLLCFLKLYTEWLAVINSYRWPFSFFRIITQPYFKFFNNIPLHFQYKSFRLNYKNTLAIGVLNLLIHYCELINLLLKYLYLKLILYRNQLLLFIKKIIL